MDKEKSERIFIKKLSQSPEIFHMPSDQSVIEGFQYFKTEAYKAQEGSIQSRPKTMIQSQPVSGLLKIALEIGRLLPNILKNINQNFNDMTDYLSVFEETGALPTSPKTLMDSYPNQTIWADLKQYAWEKHGVIVGFTALPQEYIFANKAVPFKYALVFAQEMKKSEIEKAPELDAGVEVIKVYNSLGIITNDIANWLREKYGIVCMANHPLGGLVDTVPLAAQAGLGDIGRHGLLITKEFGPRCRLSPIFIDQKIFDYTDSDCHHWIGDFCKKCGSCYRKCPTGSIYEKPLKTIAYKNVEVADRYAHYDREKCFTSFAASMGCGVCISVCPFSKNPTIYDKMKTNTLK